jgi:hypothetical protein
MSHDMTDALLFGGMDVDTRSPCCFVVGENLSGE